MSSAKDARARRPSVMNDMVSFENDGAANVETSRTAFEDDGDTRASAADGLQFSPLQNLPGIGRKSKPLDSVAASPSVRSAEMESIERGGWEDAVDGAVMASSNIINPDDMEDKLDEEARAAGFEFTPENPQQRLFVLLEEPASGTLASIIGYIIMILIFTSSTCLIVETYPSMGPCAKPEQATALGYDSPEDFCADYDTTVAEAEEAVEIFHFLEMLVILVFTAEYLLRLSLCTYRPKRNRTFANYFFKPLNIVDLISVVPWWFERIAGGSSGLAVVRMLRFARVFRLLKAGSFLKELQLFVWGYYRAREGLLLLLFLLFMYLCCFGAILYMLEYAPQSEACFEEAGFPECWGHSDALGKDAVAWDTIIEFGAGCDHCDGNLWNCTAPGNATVPAEVRMVRRLGDCIRENETAGEIFDCVPDIRLAPHYTDSDCRACSAVQWPGKEPLRCAVRGFTSIPVTTYFVMATMTTVGYGEHYPGSAYGQIACGVCMVMGIFVLALPMVIIGQAFEETIREEKKMSTVRERRLKMILLKRETEKDDSEREQGDAAKRQELEAMLVNDIARLDREKAVREQYDTNSARMIMINLLTVLGDQTADGRFAASRLILEKEPDEI